MNHTSGSDFKSQSELIEELKKRQQFRFQLGVYLSWLSLLIILLFAFSGLEAQFLGIQIRTIKLDFQFIRRHTPFIAGGIGLTILLSFFSVILASCLAFLGALGRLSKIPFVYALATFYISLIRGTPLWLQIFFFYLGLPQFRAGIQSVGIGQREAALAIGMTQRQLMQRIVLPQAIRLVIPPIGNQFIAMLKDTALVSVTGFVWEILWRAQKQGRAYFRNLEALFIAAIFYWILTIIFSLIQGRVEAYLAKGDR